MNKEEKNIKLNNLLLLPVEYYYDGWDFSGRDHYQKRVWFDTKESFDKDCKVIRDKIEAKESYIDFYSPFNFVLLLNLCAIHYIGFCIGSTGEECKNLCVHTSVQDIFIDYLINSIERNKRPDKIKKFIKEVNKVKWLR